MAHQRHADFLQDAGLHQPSVKGVPEIVKPKMPDLGVSQSRRPSALDNPHPAAVEVDDQAFRFSMLVEVCVQAFAQRNLSRLPFGRLRVRYKQNPLSEVDVFPTLRSDLAAAHPGVERHKSHGVQMVLCGFEQTAFFGDAQDLPARPPLPRHLHPSQRIGR